MDDDSDIFDRFVYTEEDDKGLEIEKEEEEE